MAIAPPSPTDMDEQEIIHMLESKDPELQLVAIRAAADARHFALEGRIARHLSSEDPRIAATAAQAIGVLSDAQAAGLLITLLGQDDPAIRAELVAALGDPDKPTSR